jgi:hypothetical protein
MSFPGLTSGLPTVVEGYPPGTSSSKGSGSPRWWPVRDLAHDRYDLLHNIAAGAAGSTLEQIANCRADRHFSIVGAGKIPIIIV